MKRTSYRFFAYLLLIAFLATAVATAATECPYTYTVTDGQATITDFANPYTCDLSITGNLSIPTTLGGYPVTAIGSWSFMKGHRLTGVTIPSGVTHIGDGAFINCTHLTSVTIPGSVVTIDHFAFKGCAGLTRVTISAGVVTFGPEAFSDCTALTNITIPASVTAIGRAAFKGCTGLTSVIIPDSVTTIGNSAFTGCNNLASIAVDAGNEYYSSVDGVLFNSLKTEILQYPGGRVGGYTIPVSVTTIGSSAFMLCTGLTSVTIPVGVAAIKWNAFNRCDGLTSVTIPASVAHISGSAFYSCLNLKKVFFVGNAPALDPVEADDMFSRFPGDGDFDSTRVTLYYRPGTTGWGATYAGCPTAVWNPDATGTSETVPVTPAATRP